MDWPGNNPWGRCEWIVGSRSENISANKAPFLTLFEACTPAPWSYIGDVNKTLPPLRPPFSRGRGAAAFRPAAFRPGTSRAWLRLAWRAGALLLAALRAASPAGAAAPAEHALGAPLALKVRQLILDKLAPAGGPAPADAPRVEVSLGRLDPRLQLSPCRKIDAYLPTGSRLWGPARVGLRCIEGERPWNVYLPVTVTHFGRGVVAVTALPAGHVLAEADLRETEVNLTEHPSPALRDAASLVGRRLAQPLGAGQSLRQAGLKPRQWFAPGDTVQLRAVGGGFAIQGRGEAVTSGLEGQLARVRTEGGKVVKGMPVGERQLEITL